MPPKAPPPPKGKPKEDPSPPPRKTPTGEEGAASPEFETPTGSAGNSGTSTPRTVPLPDLRILNQINHFFSHEKVTENDGQKRAF